MAKARLDENEGEADASETSSRAPAVARAATVLRLLASQRAGMGVSDIARRVGLVPSTAFHILRALVDEGFVTFDAENKTYRTGVGLLTLVRDAMASNDFSTVVQPDLDTLTSDFPVTAVACELDRRERMVVVAIARSDSFISLHVNVGSRFPAFISATGRCVAAASKLSKDELRSRFEALRWEKPPAFEDWYAEVQRAGREGVSMDHGNFIRGITVMATLVPNTSQRATRGIALIGFEHEMTEKTLRRLREALLASARNVGAQLS